MCICILELTARDALIAVFVVVVFHSQALSDRFCGEISDDKISMYSFFPDEYFTCPSVCLSCK